MTAEKQSVDAISAQLVELRRDLGRVAVEHGLDSKELMDVQVRCIDRDLDVQPTLWVAHEGEAH